MKGLAVASFEEILTIRLVEEEVDEVVAVGQIFGQTDVALEGEVARLNVAEATCITALLICGSRRAL